MNAKDAIRSSANLSSTVLKTYISDLDDADLMRRPSEGCNHLAWQLGHLISSEVQLLEKAAPGRGTKLPDGFAEAHSKEACKNDDPAKFPRKEHVRRPVRQSPRGVARRAGRLHTLRPRQPGTGRFPPILSDDGRRVHANRRPPPDARGPVRRGASAARQADLDVRAPRHDPT